MKKLIAIFIAVFCLASIGAKANDHQLKNAYENHQSDLQVQGSGTVIRLLPDDNEGSRHQKFILKLDSKQTLLVAHNIDLAPRVPNLKVGDRVQFYGEYEWNKKGGVMHWTHNDPNNKHPHGWLKHNGKTYE
ncbi:hypothetical protein TI24_12675 [Vibrio vulnificus]|uniref:DUF3465 domain-containing protein n=2 Tax=Vibrio TaxID=662 RepID=A0A9X4F0X8_9VIBR|nr:MULTISPECIES: DUF3465 domain-containing protein [Vibrio]ASJ38393.1 hypothetical protein VVCECT4999_06700 [Vibrio vulnificus]ASO30932.1 hypothetical protein CG015_17050 [Vibrio anguillarum]MCR9423837.1 DUF3465 domain-containing protein [Vibrio sp. RM-69-4]MDE1233331.1 DUF3465 domain-containing protein [Vibrio aestuarianus]MDE1237107.1 DUF3465 domain-containing protein [Vibrio aestuarianus]